MRTTDVRRHDMKQIVRLVGSVYVRQHGDDISRALVDELERENALLRIRTTNLRERDVRAEFRRYLRPVRSLILYALVGLVLMAGLLFAGVFMIDPGFEKHIMTVQIVGNQIVSVTIPDDTKP